MNPELLSQKIVFYQYYKTLEQALFDAMDRHEPQEIDRLWHSAEAITNRIKHQLQDTPIDAFRRDGSTLLNIALNKLFHHEQYDHSLGQLVEMIDVLITHQANLEQRAIPNPDSLSAADSIIAFCESRGVTIETINKKLGLIDEPDLKSNPMQKHEAKEQLNPLERLYKRVKDLAGDFYDMLPDELITQQLEFAITYKPPLDILNLHGRMVAASDRFLRNTTNNHSYWLSMATIWNKSKKELAFELACKKRCEPLVLALIADIDKEKRQRATDLACAANLTKPALELLEHWPYSNETARSLYYADYLIYAGSVIPKHPHESAIRYHNIEILRKIVVRKFIHTRTKKITTLSLNNYSLSELHIDELINLFKDLPLENISCLSLSATNLACLSGPDFITLMNIIVNLGPHSLNLSNIKLYQLSEKDNLPQAVTNQGANDYPTIRQFIQLIRNSNVKSLNITSSEAPSITYQGIVKLIEELIRWSLLEDLNLDYIFHDLNLYPSLTEPVITSISEALKASKTLYKLSIRNNLLCILDEEILMDFFRAFIGSPVKILDISYNRLFEAQLAPKYETALINFSNIISKSGIHTLISRENNNSFLFGDDMEDIATAIGKSKLKALDIKYMFIHRHNVDALELIFTCYSAKTSLEYLYLGSIKSRLCANLALRLEQKGKLKTTLKFFPIDYQLARLSHIYVVNTTNTFDFHPIKTLLTCLYHCAQINNDSTKMPFLNDALNIMTAIFKRYILCDFNNQDKTDMAASRHLLANMGMASNFLQLWRKAANEFDIYDKQDHLQAIDECSELLEQFKATIKQNTPIDGDVVMYRADNHFHFLRPPKSINNTPASNETVDTNEQSSSMDFTSS